MTNEQEFNSLQKEMIEAVKKECAKRKSGRIIFTEPDDYYYESDCNGLMEDPLGMVNVDGEAVFVEEGAEFGRGYDFEEDDDFVVCANMFLEDLTLGSLADLCDRLKICKRLTAQARSLEQRVYKCIETADNITILNTNCNYEFPEGDVGFYNNDCICVNKNYLMIEDEWVCMDDLNVTLYSLCQIVDAMNVTLAKRMKAPVFDGTNEFECEAYDNME